jgi:DNA-binding transcriptional LysR family regulator
MVATPIGPACEFAIVASPAFFERHPVPKTPYDLRGLPCIRHRFASGSVYQWEFERDGAELTVEVDGPLVLNDMDLMSEAARTGVGLAYVFEWSVRAQIARGELVRVLRDWCPAYPGFFLYYPSRQHQPAVLRAFLDFVRAG